MAGAAKWLALPGPGPWIAVLAVATLAAVVLDGLYGAGPTRTRASHALGSLALGAAASWAMFLAWSPAPAGHDPLLQAVAWWLLVLPVFALGAATPGVEGPRVVARLAASQAAPAVLLAFTPALGFRPVGMLAAGLVRIAAPPLHPACLAAAEALSAGGLCVLLVAGVVVGGPLAVSSAVALPEGIARWLVMGLAVAAGVTGMAAPSEPHLLRRVAAWASVQAGLAVLLARLPESAVGRDPAALALSHLAASAAGLPLLLFTLGRVVVWTRVADLAAHGGLLSSTLVRAQAVVASALASILIAAQAPLALLAALLSASLGVERVFLGIALAGWIGAALGLVLGAYRMVRGRRAAPGEPVPELGRLEALLTLLLIAAAVLSLIYPRAWSAPPAWTSGARASAPGPPSLR